MDSLFEKSIEELKTVYRQRYFTDEKMYAKGDGLVFTWPGADENVLVHVHQSEAFTEPFHSHDYYYFKYAYKGSFESLSNRFGDAIRVDEGEMYIGQPNACHAIRVHDNLNVVMVCLIVRKETMFRTFLPMLVGHKEFFHFLLNPSLDESSDEYIHLRSSANGNLVRLLKMIVIEHANHREDSDAIITSLMHAFLAQVAREAQAEGVTSGEECLEARMLDYISQHIQTVTLESLAAHFSYHANYLSTLLSQKVGSTFSEIVLEQRMSRAVLMLEGTDLSVEEIGRQLGYATKSGFYKAFREYFGTTPRGYLEKGRRSPGNPGR